MVLISDTKYDECSVKINCYGKKNGVDKAPVKRSSFKTMK